MGLCKLCEVPQRHALVVRDGGQPAAIRAEGDTTATLNGVSVEKTDGDASSSDASSFYGLNAAVLALDNAVLNINGGTVTAAAEGANGVFAYDGATINIKDTVVNVSGGNAGGPRNSGWT